MQLAAIVMLGAKLIFHEMLSRDYMCSLSLLEGVAQCVLDGMLL